MSAGAIVRLDHASAVAAAARNNAEWCDAVCRTHGLPGVFARHAWTSPRRTPTFYPDAVTLTSFATPGDVLPAIDTAAPGASVKDSYAAWDLTGHGFDLLFEAEWLLRHAETPPRAATPWTEVRDATELADWEAAWAGGADSSLFRPQLLEDRRVVFVAAPGHTAGAALTRGGDVVGVSNLFARDGDLEAAWAGCLAALAELAPGLPVVGYESGDALAAARRQGITATGTLRVWMQRDPLR